MCVNSILNEMDEFGNRDYPKYGQLDEVIEWKDDKFFIVKLFSEQYISFFYKYIYELRSSAH